MPLFILLILLVLPGIILAQGFEFDSGDEIATSLNLPTKDVESVVIKYIQYALYFTGMTTVLMILYGGLRYMTSAGNEETVKNAKAIVRNAAIGLMLVMLAWAILNFIAYLIVDTPVST